MRPKERILKGKRAMKLSTKVSFCAVIATVAFCSSVNKAYAEEGYPVYYNNYLSSTYNGSVYAPQQAPTYQNNGYSPYGTAQQSYYPQQNTGYTTPVPPAQQVQKGTGYTEYQIEEVKPVDNTKYLLKGPMGMDIEFSMGRVFSDFEFQLTPENENTYDDARTQGSILEWDDMIFNEMKLKIRKDFTLDKNKENKMFAFAEYKKGSLVQSGDSRDDDMRVDPYYYTSIGGIEANTNGYKVGLGWTDAFKLDGFKFSPTMGYTNQSHNLTMTDQAYALPEPVYYYTEDDNGNSVLVYDEDANPMCAYYTDSVTAGSIEDDTGTDIPLWIDSDGDGQLDTQLASTDLIYIGYDEGGDCTVGGTGSESFLAGPVQIYNTNWSGFFLGSFVNKVFGPKDSIQFYGEFAIMDFLAEANWVRRTDLAGPMYDKAKAIGYTFEMTYKHKIARDMDLTFNANFETFSLFGSATTDINFSDGTSTHIENSMMYADWNSMGFHLGLQKLF